MKTEPEKLPPELEAAFEALNSYGSGGKRSALLPIDAAVSASLADPARRELIERRLAGVLESDAPTQAKQYACTRLALVATSLSVRSVSGLLGHPVLATDARTVLEAMQDPAASKALAKEMSRLTGLERAGAIASLAVKRYKPAARLIRRDLQNPDPVVKQAAATALAILESRQIS